MTAAIVIGTGRSGTSLAMQALDALGLPMIGDAVPASENNLRGTGEAVGLRDAMFRLHRALGSPRGFMPDGWQDTRIARETRDWLANYFLSGRDGIAQHGFAMKFPLSSLFLPLVGAAARDAGVEPVWIWATRPPSEVISSLMRSYRRDVEHDAAVWAQRSFYLLRDAPDDTWLLPYENWRKDPDGQVGYLAEMVGCDDAERVAAAKSCFAASLDHAPAVVPPMPAKARSVAERISSAMDGQKGRLRDVVDRESTSFSETMRMLGDALNQLVPSPVLTDDESGMRLAALDRFARDPKKEAEMKDELEVLANRIREVAAENARLRRMPDPASNDSGDQAAPASGMTPPVFAEIMRLREAEIAQQAEEIETLRSRLAEALAAAEAHDVVLQDQRAQFDALQQSYQTLAQARDDAEEDAETYHRAKLSAAEMRANSFERLATRREADIENLKQRLNAAQTQADTDASNALREEMRVLSASLEAKDSQLSELAAQLAESEAERERMLASKSWRITAPLRGFRRMTS